MSYYLLDHPPARSQFRTTRRADPTGCIVAHTAESMLDVIDPDTGAENVARFISRRTDAAGSYHRIGDRDSIVPMMPFSYEAFHDGTGSNRWSIGISLAMRAAEWPKLDGMHRHQLVVTMAKMAAEAAQWLKAEHGVTVPARRITKAQSNAGWSGFIAHGERDPGRRSDPGPGFPWDAFLIEYVSQMSQPPPETENDMTPAEIAAIKAIQQIIVNEGISIGTSGPNNDGIDGIPGSLTVNGVHALKNRTSANPTHTEAIRALKAALGTI